MSTTVDALLPLSLLEAVRSVDTPEGDHEAEFVPELLNKRLGTSDTVYAQIRRYTDAVKRNQRSGQDEAVALARLIGRRPDAESIFRAAGRHLARESYLTIPSATRSMIESLPTLLARPLALRRMARLAHRYLNGTIRRTGAFILLEVPSSVTLDTAPRAIGCTFYEAFLKELLRLLGSGASTVDHVRCQSRREGVCAWRAEWRPETRG